MRGAAIPSDHDPALPRRLSVALAAVFGVASLIGLGLPSVFHDAPAWVGNARGTCLAIVALAIPVMLASAMRARSTRGTIVWLGAIVYLVYNAVIFAFAVGFNALFPLYVAALSLSVCVLVALLQSVHADAIARAASPRMPVRAIGGYLVVVAILFALTWLADVVPAMVTGARPAGLRGTSLLTSPVEVLDLGFTLPLTVIGGVRMWKRRTSGYLIAGVMLVMFELEAASVALDQTFGHLADPTQSWATAPLFAAFALVGLVPTLVYFRHVTGTSSAGHAVE